jgi:hypothetical protein
LLEPFEYLPARQRPFELTHEFLQVMLHDAVQIDQLAVDVVDHFNLGRRTQEVTLRPREHLDIAIVRGKRGMMWSARRRLPPIQGMMGFAIVKAVF